jgi:hypothetical protein
MQIKITEDERVELVELAITARDAADGGSNDEEIAALREALAMALVLLSVDIPDDEPEVDPDLHRKQLAEDPDAF